VFPPRRRGEITDHHPPAIFRAFLHCYYKNVYGIRPVTRELQNTVVWLGQLASIDRRRETRSIASSPTSNTSSTRSSDSVEQAACRGLLDLTYSIDSTDVRTMPADQDAAVESYDRTAEEPTTAFCTIGLDRAKDPDCRGVHREQASSRRETAMRVTCDALAVEKPIWMLETALDDTLAAARPPAGRRVVPVDVAYNARNTDDPKDIEYARLPASTNDSEDVHERKPTVFRRPSTTAGAEFERTRPKTAGLRRRREQPPPWSRTNGPVTAARRSRRGRVHARAQVFLALCLRLVIAITNDERGDNPGSTVITL